MDENTRLDMVRRIGRLRRIDADCGMLQRKCAAKGGKIRRDPAQGVEALHRNEGEGQAGGGDRWPVRVEANVLRRQAERGGDLRAILQQGVEARRLRRDEIRPDRALKARNLANDRARPLLQHQTQGLAAEHFRRAQFRDQASGADGRMAGERKFRRRRENAQPRRMDIGARLDDEDRLGQIELARYFLHLVAVQPLRLRDDSERIAAKRPLGEDIEEMVGEARHASLCAFRSRSIRRR